MANRSGTENFGALLALDFGNAVVMNVECFCTDATPIFGIHNKTTIVVNRELRLGLIGVRYLIKLSFTADLARYFTSSKIASPQFRRNETAFSDSALESKYLSSVSGFISDS
jgi:hypothetical protein